MQRKRNIGKRRRHISSILFILLFAFAGCGSKMPPPGKPDIDPPSIKITYPVPFDTIKGIVNVKYLCTDKSPVMWVKLYVDGRIFYTDSAVSFSIPFKSDTLYDGKHNLMLEAKDKWDNAAKSPIVTIITNNGKKKEDKNEGVDRIHNTIR